jgi:hypothetical protein
LRYDWYVIQNKVASTATTISDIDGVKSAKVKLEEIFILAYWTTRVYSKDNIIKQKM